MTACVPTLTGSVVITDPQSIIAYIWRKFTRTPKHAVPLLDEEIISLPYLVSKYGPEPENLATNIQSDLQRVFNRIFGEEREVNVSVSHIQTSDTAYNVSVSIFYSTLSGEIVQVGTTVSLRNGRLAIPEDTLGDPFKRL